MPIASVRRRIGALEIFVLAASLVEYAPLTWAEIEAITHWIETGTGLIHEDVTRVKRQSSIVEGELLMTAASLRKRR